MSGGGEGGRGGGGWRGEGWRGGEEERRGARAGARGRSGSGDEREEVRHHHRSLQDTKAISGHAGWSSKAGLKTLSSVVSKVLRWMNLQK